MKKVLSLIAILCIALVCFAACDFVPESTTKAPCEHNWVDATCEAPKTCSECGETEGAALGHNAIEVLGQAPTCTEPGQTNFVYCDVCDENLSEAKEIPALGHTEETVAGKAPTCTEPGKTDGKKCSVCGVTTVEQTDIEALSHTPEADDGDVTTAVVCANGCGHIFVEAKEAITLTIPTFENGAVVADKMNYAIGDTVKLTINPDWGYAQKLYINGETLILDWNNNVYTFVAEKDTYVISGSFELVLDMAAGDVTRWDYSNQAHGLVTTYYPNNNDAWWFQINGDYKVFSITAKNYRNIENSYENGPDGGWRIALYMKLDNGNYYAFSMWIDTNKIYAYQHFGGKIAGDKDSTTGWSGAWRNLAEWNADATAALNGDGAEFKLERIDGNHIQISFGGVVLETYEIPGVTAENKVVAVGLHHWGNRGSYVDIPFAVTEACEHTWVDATCTAPKTCSKCQMTIGEKIEHTAGEAVVENNKEADCVNTGSYDKVVYCTVCGGEVSRETITVSALGHKDENADYKCDVCGANLCTNHVPGTTVVENEIAPDFDKTGSYENVTYCTICGMETSRETVTVPAVKSITLTIPTFENGSVTADKQRYAIGDTVTLTLAPASGYFQKLFINGEPLILDWKTKVYSFVAEKDTYVIDGSFEPTLEVYAGDWGRWDNNNQAHGILSAYYPNNNDAWWYKIKGDFASFSINAKNYRNVANSYEGGPDGGWRIALYMQLDNGNYYAFSIWIDASQKYAYNHYGGKIAGEKDSVTTWGGAWRDLAVVNPEATAALNGNGAEFKLERIDGNHIRVTFGDTVLETYEIPGVTAANKVVSVGLHHWGNKGAHVEIPFSLTVPTEEPPVTDGDVTLNIGEFANGTVTVDKESYNVGDTVTLTVSPAKDYAQKLYINGQPILVDTNSKYSFVVEEGKTYDITGEFVNVKGDWFWTAEYGVLNQAHGVFHSPVPAGGEKNGELVPTADKCYGGKVLVKDPSNGTKQDFAIVLKMTFSDGQKAELRLVNKDGKGHYMIQSMSGMFGSWKWYYDLNDEENAAVANGEGVWFELVRDGANIDIKLNGKVISHRADTPISLAENTVLNQFKVTTYNYSYAIDVKYEFYIAE